MAKHQFGVIHDGTMSGSNVQCIRCGIIVPQVDGKISDVMLEQECKREDFSQAAARIVKEATKDS